jgi:hypothetical protein
MEAMMAGSGRIAAIDRKKFMLMIGVPPRSCDPDFIRGWLLRIASPQSVRQARGDLQT